MITLTACSHTVPFSPLPFFFFLVHSSGVGLGLPVNPTYDTAAAIDQSAQTAIEEALLYQASQASDWETTQDQIEKVIYPLSLLSLSLSLTTAPY